MSDLSAGQIVELRRNWLRDEWLDSPAFRGISFYNTAVQRAFFTNDQIKALDDYVANEYSEELTALRIAKVNERLNLGDDQTTADGYGVLAERYARYRLIRAEGFTQMVADAGFLSVLSKNYAAVLDTMRTQITSDRGFVLQRTGLVVLRRHRS